VKTSVVIPSKGCKYLVYSLRGLRDQVVKPSEVILVVKDCRVEFIENYVESILYHVLSSSRKRAMSHAHII